MRPTDGQKNIRGYNRFYTKLYVVIHFIAPSYTISLKEVALAMINCALNDYPSNVLEMKDIKLAAKDNW